MFALKQLKTMQMIIIKIIVKFVTPVMSMWKTMEFPVTTVRYGTILNAKT